MLNLKPAISKIEKLLEEDTEASITYAALECRLAIERICYERLRIAHDYISHDDILRWQPRDIVRTLIQEVDANAADALTMSICTTPIPEGVPELTLEDYQEMEFVPVGTQTGFNHNKLGRLWNALANLALHIHLPKSKADSVAQYGDRTKISEKVSEALEEIRRIGEGTLMLTGTGEELSFSCSCSSRNKRRLELLTDGQTVSCINPDCHETYTFAKSDLTFERRTVEFVCQVCSKNNSIPKKTIEKLPTDQAMKFDCVGCRKTIHVVWKLMQGQVTNSERTE